MIESKSGFISIFVEQTKLVGDVAVGICFPLDISVCAAKKLWDQAHCECYPKGAEQASIVCALAYIIRRVLCGDPLAISRSKVGDVKFIAHNGMVGINWNVNGTVSAVRKSLGIAFKFLEPAKMYPLYARLMRKLGKATDREQFNYVADETIRAIKKHLAVTIVGKIKIEKAQLDDMLKILSNKLTLTPVTSKKSKPDDFEKCNHEGMTEVAVSGWKSAVLHDFLVAKVNGLQPVLYQNYLLLPIKPAQWTTTATKLKKYIKDYATTKYGKVKKDLPALFAYLTLTNASLCASDAAAAVKAEISASVVEGALNKLL